MHTYQPPIYPCVCAYSTLFSCPAVPNSLQPDGLYVARQAPLSMGFSRQAHWSGLPFPSPKGTIERKKAKSLSRIQLSTIPWTTAYQAPPSMESSRQEYWSVSPFPSTKLVWTFLKKKKNTVFQSCTNNVWPLLEIFLRILHKKKCSTIVQNVVGKTLLGSDISMTTFSFANTRSISN